MRSRQVQGKRESVLLEKLCVFVFKGYLASIGFKHHDSVCRQTLTSAPSNPYFKTIKLSALCRGVIIWFNCSYSKSAWGQMWRQGRETLAEAQDVSLHALTCAPSLSSHTNARSETCQITHFTHSHFYLFSKTCHLFSVLNLRHPPEERCCPRRKPTCALKLKQKLNFSHMWASCSFQLLCPV